MAQPTNNNLRLAQAGTPAATDQAETAPVASAAGADAAQPAAQHPEVQAPLTQEASAQPPEPAAGGGCAASSWQGAASMPGVTGRVSAASTGDLSRSLPLVSSRTMTRPQSAHETKISFMPPTDSYREVRRVRRVILPLSMC